MRQHPSIRERLEMNIQRSAHNECWMWSGRSVSSGYGVIHYNGRQHGAHRVAYELFVGPVPEGAFVCHRCDVSLCVNPAHLYAADHRQNMDDASRRKRFPAQAKTHCVRGHPLEGANLYLTTSSNGRQRRQCRACNRIAAAAYKRRALA